MDDEYTPIACDRYSELELAILRRQRLRLSLRGRGGLRRIETLDPVNLRTRRQAEYLIARNPAGLARVLRLDRIAEARPL
ncbi:WYL domain-containing protein [Acidihalobacter prosperus]|uniref:Transcriptional antiterminator, Rof n=1 Tax=Acidihalobacter prosperus TaxID=160660 RepID=A0A1A6C1E4_9GAMM|nr:WYL domain-containing protein [Acidihalobacter prosperus]OBS08369.1 transcriptional antiterminator, Rof [Acidihalobacter prosperus]